MIPLPYFVYYLVVACVFVALAVAAIIKDDKQTPPVIDTSEIKKVLINKETEWVKALTNISLLILTACLASLYTPIAQNDILRTLTGLMAFASLANLFFGVYIHLSEYFNISYRAGFQKENCLHRALYRLSKRLAPYWHLTPFIISLIQLVVAGHIIVALFF
ncbi:MAG: hypothetical protein IJN23_03630 [Akkermansia sp.]|nr:hypothetical protein [Akkermansia sp.]